MKLIKYLAMLLTGILLIFSCKTAPICVLDRVSETIGPEPRIIVGKVSQDIFLANHSDTATLTIDYSYYSTQFSSNLMDSVYKDSINSLIAKIVSSETILESGIYPLQHHFFVAQLDSMATEWNLYKAEESTPWEMEMDTITTFNLIKVQGKL